MLELEKQVTGLELSKRLEALGVKQESLFYWCQSIDDSWHISYEDSVCLKALYKKYSAFTVAELGKILPNKIKRTDEKRTVYPYDFLEWPKPCPANKWKGYIYRAEGGAEKHFKGETEVDARAVMLIYLIENNLLKLS